MLASSHSKKGPDLGGKLGVSQRAQNESLPCCISWLPMPPTPASQTRTGPELNPRRLSARPYVPFCPVMAASLHMGPWPLRAPCQVQIQPPRLRPPESPESPASAPSREVCPPFTQFALHSSSLFSTLDIAIPTLWISGLKPRILSQDPAALSETRPHLVPWPRLHTPCRLLPSRALGSSPWDEREEEGLYQVGGCGEWREA